MDLRSVLCPLVTGQRERDPDFALSKLGDALGCIDNRSGLWSSNPTLKETVEGKCLEGARH